MKSDDWRDMDSAPLNEYGRAYGPTVLLWCSNSDTPVAAYYQPFGSVYDNKPRWKTVEEGAEILCEDAVAWMPIAAPWSVQEITPEHAELKGETMIDHRYPPEYWTDTLRDICRENCAYHYREPPCWQDVDDSETVGPCWSCYNKYREMLAND